MKNIHRVTLSLAAAFVLGFLMLLASRPISAAPPNRPVSTYSTATPTKTAVPGCPPNVGALASYSYTVTHPNGGSFTATDITGRLTQGDTVKVSFTVSSSCTSVQLSLVSYTAP